MSLQIVLRLHCSEEIPRELDLLVLLQRMHINGMAHRTEYTIYHTVNVRAMCEHACDLDFVCDLLPVLLLVGQGVRGTGVLKSRGTRHPLCQTWCVLSAFAVLPYPCVVPSVEIFVDGIAVRP